MLVQVKKHLPLAFNFILASYGTPSFLSNNDNIIMSEEGVQQGDPLGPLLFCLTIQPIIAKLKCPLNVWYMDDGTLGGEVEHVNQDFITLKEEALKIGLNINEGKCEIFNVNNCPHFDQMKQINESNFTLLGAPITADAISTSLCSTKIKMERLLEKLKILPMHYAYKILQSSFGAPTLISTLRASPCYQHPALEEIDLILKSSIEILFNVSLNDNNWLQSSLPINCGGIGIRKPSSLSLSAYIASVKSVLNMGISISHLNNFLTYSKIWCEKSNSEDILSRQKDLDQELCKKSLYTILSQSSPIDKSRITSASHKNSGDWLKATPNQCCGIFLNNDEFRNSIALRLGTPIFSAHTCKCGIEIDTLGGHCFACSRNPGKILRHTMVNDCLSSTLQSAGISNIKEPTGVMNEYHLRPDGMTLIPFKRGQCLTWDVSCPHPLCASHVQTNKEPGDLSSTIELKKRNKYCSLTNNFIFEPVIIDTIGAHGKSTENLLKLIGKLIIQKTKNKQSATSFRQRLSVAVQKGNSIALAFSLQN